MPRTQTSHLPFLKRPDVTYDFTQPADSVNSHVTTITVPPGSRWRTGLHWHETHEEYLTILRGTALVTLGTATRSYGSGSGSSSSSASASAPGGRITVPRGVVHEWRRDPASEGELVVEESTGPPDGQKELFFRNLCSAILDMASAPGRLAPWPRPLTSFVPLGWGIELQVWMFCWRFDNYPVIAWAGLPASSVVTHAVLLWATVVGTLLGLKAEYVEYTPSPLVPGEKSE